MKKFSWGHWNLTREFCVAAREFLDLWWVINPLKRWKEFTDLSKGRCNLNEIPNFLNLYQERADAFLFVKFLNKGSLFPITKNMYDFVGCSANLKGNVKWLEMGVENIGVWIRSWKINSWHHAMAIRLNFFGLQNYLIFLFLRCFNFV